jgi:hypothetical protein
VVFTLKATGSSLWLFFFFEKGRNKEHVEVS